MTTDFGNTSSGWILMKNIIDQLKRTGKQLCVYGTHSPSCGQINLRALFHTNLNVHSTGWGDGGTLKLKTSSSFQPRLPYSLLSLQESSPQGTMCAENKLSTEQSPCFAVFVKAGCVRWGFLLKGGPLESPTSRTYAGTRGAARGGDSELPEAGNVPYAVTDATHNVLGMPPV